MFPILHAKQGQQCPIGDGNVSWPGCPAERCSRNVSDLEHNAALWAIIFMEGGVNAESSFCTITPAGAFTQLQLPTGCVTASCSCSCAWGHAARARCPCHSFS
jgi:hypothetical protein